MILTRVPRQLIGEVIVFQTNGAEATGYQMQENEVELMSYVKINPEWINDLNIIIKTIKLFEGTINMVFMT